MLSAFRFGTAVWRLRGFSSSAVVAVALASLATAVPAASAASGSSSLALPSTVMVNCNGQQLKVDVNEPRLPSELDPTTLSQSAIESYGYPPKPSDPSMVPAWKALLKKPVRWIVPQCGPPVSHGHVLEPLSPHANGGPSSSSASINWSGNIATIAGSYSNVEMTWNVPPMYSPRSADPNYTSIWPGLGGGSSVNDMLVQMGTEQNTDASGGWKLYAWWETYPYNAQQPIQNFTVHFNDQMYAHIQVGFARPESASFHLIDQSTNPIENVSFSEPVSGLCNCSQAEWILERTSLKSGTTCTGYPVPNFDQVNVTNAEAVTYPSGSWQGVGALSHYGNFIRDDNLQVMAVPKALTNGGTGFPIDWGGQYGDVDHWSC